MRVIVAALALLALTGSAQAATRPRAGLQITAGAVDGVAPGRVGGTFTIRNAGRVTSRASLARLTVQSSARTWTTIKTYTIPALRPAAAKRVTVRSVALLARLARRTMAVRVCAGARCRTVGSTRIPRRAAPAVPPTTPTPSTPVTVPPDAGGTPSPGAPVRPADTTPAHPVPFTKSTDLRFTDAQSGYWLYVPDGYDASHRTPTQLFVWIHGCGGDAQGDLDTYARSSQAYIMLSLDGARADDGCWNVATDAAKVLAAIADAEDHFNIDRRRVVIGGYSSGGDLAYRTAFQNASTFAGLLAENTSPFRDTGPRASDAIAGAAWRFPIVHLAHTGDTTYPLSGVRDEIGQLQQAGWTVTLVTRPGAHYDSHTDADLEQVLLPHLADGWTAP